MRESVMAKTGEVRPSRTRLPHERTIPQRWLLTISLPLLGAIALGVCARRYTVASSKERSEPDVANGNVGVIVRFYAPLPLLAVLAASLFTPISGAAAQNASPSAPVAAPAEMLLIPKGTKITVKTVEDVRSNHAKEGDNVYFILASEVRSPEGRLLLSAGTSARGKVTEVRRAGWFGRPGKIAIACQSIHPTGVAGDYPPVQVVAESKAKIENVARDNTFPAVAAATFTGLVAGGAVDFQQNFHLNLSFGFTWGGGGGINNSSSSSPNHTLGIVTGIATTTLIGALWRGREATLKRGTAFVVVVPEDTLLSLIAAEPASAVKE